LLDAGEPRAGEGPLKNGRIGGRRVRTIPRVPEERRLDDDPDAEVRDARDQVRRQKDRMIDPHALSPVGKRAHRGFDRIDRGRAVAGVTAASWMAVMPSAA